MAPVVHSPAPGPASALPQSAATAKDSWKAPHGGPGKAQKHEARNQQADPDGNDKGAAGPRGGRPASGGKKQWAQKSTKEASSSQPKAGDRHWGADKDNKSKQAVSGGVGKGEGGQAHVSKTAKGGIGEGMENNSAGQGHHTIGKPDVAAASAAAAAALRPPPGQDKGANSNAGAESVPLASQGADASKLNQEQRKRAASKQQGDGGGHSGGKGQRNKTVGPRPASAGVVRPPPGLS